MASNPRRARRPITPLELSQLNEGLARTLEARVLDSRGLPLPARMADEALVSATSSLLRSMLQGRRTLGLTGWHEKSGRNAKLRAELLEHVTNGNMIEAIRVAAIIHAREHVYGPDA
jgi:hypothetical protein